MDNREAVSKFFVEPAKMKARVSQIVSLTGFQFCRWSGNERQRRRVGVFAELNLPYRRR
jgi:hypothetical protein